MNLEKTERLITLLRANGVSHFKSEDVEINFGSIAPVQSLPVQLEQSPPFQAVPPTEISIPHHVNEVQNLLKLNDNDLVDKLFPDYSQMKEA